MRPINKGVYLYRLAKYEDAQQPLVVRLGEYCSYCERWIASAIHVEHKKPKKEYPTEQYSWGNFLLSCSNCNSSKSHGEMQLGDYLWPDADNTFCIFEYDEEGRVLPRLGFDEEVQEKIIKTWQLTGLNKHPDINVFDGMEKPSDKDNRWSHRSMAWRKAIRYKEGLKIVDSLERRHEAVEMAKERGMFSVWMAVFQDNVEMCRLLIDAFPNTAKDCFDSQGKPIQRPNGIL
ncbi:HNH endonuclease [Moraxellaceae bacterium AER2_44_116]|nr:HNH endonuclease [Moraxellaceae bacterium]TQC96037.1 HNH endonuclease [Moraxellaceae bacterium AER2_44_116]